MCVLCLFIVFHPFIVHDDDDITTVRNVGNGKMKPSRLDEHDTSDNDDCSFNICTPSYHHLTCIVAATQMDKHDIDDKSTAETSTSHSDGMCLYFIRHSCIQTI